MAVIRRQKSGRSFAATVPSPIVNIAERRSVRGALQPNRKPIIFVAVPTLDGNVHFSIATIFARIMASAVLPECPFRFAVHVEPGKRGIDFARNSIVRLFLEQTDADWLIMIDQDQVVPDNFWQLCTVTDADVVSALVPVWVGHMDPEAFLRVNNYGLNAEGHCYNLPIPADTVQQPYRVPIVGTGAIAIRRRVFAPRPAGVGDTPFYFTFMDDRKVRAGEDINFSVEANRCGFTLAVHPSVRFDHVKALSLWQVEQYRRASLAMAAAGKQTTDAQRLSIG